MLKFVRDRTLLLRLVYWEGFSRILGNNIGLLPKRCWGTCKGLSHSCWHTKGCKTWSLWDTQTPTSQVASMIEDQRVDFFFLARAAKSWRSAKQKAMSTSTMEVEFIALFETTKKGLWLKNLITFMRIVDTIQGPLTIHCDNKAALFFQETTRNLRPLDWWMSNIYQWRNIWRREIKIEHVDTRLMLADPLTKPHAVGIFKDHVSNIGKQDGFFSAEVWE